MELRDKVLAFVRMRGPALPVQVSKEIGKNPLIASALLSELVDKKDVLLSHVKFGSSPLYYVPGQEAKLPDLLYKYLNDKEKKSFELLKQKKALRDLDLDPVTRVSLRNIKDFAIQVDVFFGGKRELFWRWYLNSEEDVTPLIKSMLGIVEKARKEEIDPETLAVNSGSNANTGALEHNGSSNSQQKTQNATILEMNQGQNNVSSNNPTGTPSKLSQLISAIKNEVNPLNKSNDNRYDHDKTAATQQSNKTLNEKEHNANVSDFIDVAFPKDEFFVYVHKYFTNNNIKIVSHKLLRKDSELEFVVSIPSSVGDLQYYCRAKNKKKCSEGDLTTAFFSGQNKKLPILFLTTGEVTKKAVDLTRNEFKSMTIKTI